MHLTVGRTGLQKTVGIPGTGVYYTSRHGYHSGYHSAKSEVARPPAEQAIANRQVERTLGGLLVLGVIVIVILALL